MYACGMAALATNPLLFFDILDLNFFAFILNQL